MAKFEELGTATSPWRSGDPAAKASKDQEMQPWAPWVVPLESTSTYAAHFQPWGVARSKSCKPKVERIPPTAFSGRSTAQDSYMPWDADHRRESCKPTSKTMGENPLESSTTHREAYRAWNIGKQPSFKPSQQALATTAFSGRSTAQDSYMAHEGARPPNPFLPAETVGEKTTFNSISTMSASYLPWPVQKGNGAVKPVATLDLGADSRLPTGTTVHRDAFTELRLPPGCKASLGVQVTPGSFHLMIPKGTAAPCQKSGIFTTTINDQQIIEVVVIALASDDVPVSSGLELGRFSLGRIQPMRVGTVQVDVTMYLGADQSIRVSAHNRQSDHCVSLNIRDKFKFLKF